MKAMNPFFVIGTAGMIITAVLHIILAVFLNIPSVHTVFFVMYPMFSAFLCIGFGQMLKKHKAALIKIRS